MPGQVYAILCAFIWALSSALLQSQTYKIHIVSMSTLRTLPALLLYWGIVLFSARWDALRHLPPRAWIFLSASAFLGLVVGDLLYFTSMKLVGLSRAMPISATYPFFTMLLAVLFLGEHLDWATLGGAVLIGGGAYFIAFTQKSKRVKLDIKASKINLRGIALAFGAAICWSSSTVMLRIGLEGVDATVANAIRLSVMVIFLGPMFLRQNKISPVETYGQSTLLIIFLSGIIGTGLGTFFFLKAVQLIGAARTSILTAMTPLFGIPFSLFLREKLSRRTVLGTVLTITGVWLTIS